MQKWLRGLYGWSTMQTYVIAVHEETGNTLSKIREQHMEEMNDLND